MVGLYFRRVGFWRVAGMDICDLFELMIDGEVEV